MSQATLRQWHRTVGIVIALFVLVQAGTGFILEWEHFTPAAHEHGHEHEEPQEEGAAVQAAETIHHGSFLAATRPLVSAYRLLLAAGLIWMAVSGAAIFLQMRSRRAARRK